MEAQQAVFIDRLRVEKVFDEPSKRILSLSELRAVIQDNRERWQPRPPPSESTAEKLVKTGRLWRLESPTEKGIVALLTRNSVLQQIRLGFPYRPVRRFVRGEVPTLDVVQSLDARGYFSHYTAMQLNDLTDQVPKTIYFNVEQTATGGGGDLTQEALDRAFKGKSRISTNVTQYRDLRICRLNGRNTGQLGVVSTRLENPRRHLRVTNIERTLIDATVRPAYAGGILEVAQAFRAAADRASVNRIAAYLRQLAYTYPYHQAIGFYLERAGEYKESQIELLREFPLKFDFYLTHNMRSTEYNDRWRLFVPKGF